MRKSSKLQPHMQIQTHMSRSIALNKTKILINGILGGFVCLSAIAIICEIVTRKSRILSRCIPNFSKIYLSSLPDSFQLYSRSMLESIFHVRSLYSRSFRVPFYNHLGSSLTFPRAFLHQSSTSVNF